MKHFFLLLCGLALSGCGAHTQWSKAVTSWYGPGFAGKPTASGERFRPHKRTAAHKTLPFGTVLRVRIPDSSRSVRVVINDRGPFVKGRALDLSKGAARRLGMLDVGVSPVEIKVVGCKKNRFHGPRSCSAAQ